MKKKICLCIGMLLIACLAMQAQTVKAGIITCDGVPYTVSIGAIGTNEDGNTTVEIQGEKVGTLLFRNGEMLSPFGIKLVINNKEFGWKGANHSKGAAIFNFATTQKPDKIIVYGNYGESTSITFDGKTKGLVK